MIISTNWLADYVQVPGAVDDLVERLLMSGLNHESTTSVGSDTAVEIEVTSNRPDCLGHIGVAREAAVLFGRPLHVPDPRPLEGVGDAAASVAIEIRSPEICPCYTARVIRGVHVGPSPAWLVDRLATVGIASVNNIVDVTNYVMLECGQPLHAFDLAKLRGGRIVVRRAAEGEPFTAINHKTYTLTDRMCVIADAERPVALAGVGVEVAQRDAHAPNTRLHHPSRQEKLEHGPRPVGCLERRQLRRCHGIAGEDGRRLRRQIERRSHAAGGENPDRLIVKPIPAADRPHRLHLPLPTVERVQKSPPTPQPIDRQRRRERE